MGRASDNTGNGTEKSINITKLVVSLVILAAALIFIFSNRGTATLHFLSFQFVAPGWAWFLVLLAAGVVIGSIFPWFRKKKK
ncbi:hypothetical protein ACXR2T_11105 [Leucobacter sp. HY1910]